MPRFIPQYPSDYHAARSRRVEKEAEEHFLNDPNPYSVDPCLDVSEADYRATIEISGGFLVVRTSGVEHLPVDRFTKLWFSPFVCAVTALLINIAISEFLVRDHIPGRLVFLLVVLPGMLLLLHFSAAGRRGAADWAKNGKWEMWFSARHTGYARSLGKREEEHALPVYGTKIGVRGPESRAMLDEPEWFAPVCVRLIDGELEYLFPCASKRECDWLVAEIERFRATIHPAQTSEADRPPEREEGA